MEKYPRDSEMLTEFSWDDQNTQEDIHPQGTVVFCQRFDLLWTIWSELM